LVVLITAAADLTMAIPALFFYRYFREPIDDLILGIEAEALKLV
jgi:biopolymer transport protein ExbB